MRYRRSLGPARIVGDRVVALSAAHDRVVVLDGAAAFVWVALDDWMTEQDLVDTFSATVPQGSGSPDRVIEALTMLADGGLVDRRGP